MNREIWIKHMEERAQMRNDLIFDMPKEKIGHRSWVARLWRFCPSTNLCWARAKKSNVDATLPCDGNANGAFLEQSFDSLISFGAEKCHKMHLKCPPRFKGSRFHGTDVLSCCRDAVCFDPKPAADALKLVRTLDPWPGHCPGPSPSEIPTNHIKSAYLNRFQPFSGIGKWKESSHCVFIFCYLTYLFGSDGSDGSGGECISWGSRHANLLGDFVSIATNAPVNRLTKNSLHLASHQIQSK